MAATPSSWRGMLTVVSAGLARRATLVLPKPTTLRSSGTRSPAMRAASTAPSAISSFAAKIAVGPSLASSRLAASNPPA